MPDPTSSIEFGWLKEPFAAEDDRIAIVPKDDWKLAVSVVVTSESYGAEMVFNPISRPGSGRPAVPSGRFALPTTHLLRWKHRTEDRAFASFSIAVLGFLLGLHLLPLGAGHLQATPHNVGHLVNFRTTPSEVLRGLQIAATTYDRIGSHSGKSLFAAIYWYSVSQGYAHWHDRFAWTYTAVDCLHVVTHATDPEYRKLVPARGEHAKRINALQQHYGSPIPKEFVDRHRPSGNVAALTDMRNTLIHEAAFAGEPIGYAVTSHESEMTYALRHFCSQIILGALGIECDFRKAENDFQVHGLDLV